MRANRRAIAALGAAALVACASAPAPRDGWERAGPVGISYVGSGVPVLEAVLEGEDERIAAKLVLDTGHDTRLPPVVLRREATSRLGLGPSAASEALTHASGRPPRPIVLPALELDGACRVERVSVLPVVSVTVPGLGLADLYDGVLGLAAFPLRAVVIDPARSRVQFVPLGDVAAIASASGAVSLEARRAPHGLVVPVTFRTPLGPVTLELRPSTGAARSSLAGVSLARLGGTPIDALLGRVHYDLELGGITIPRAELEVHGGTEDTSVIGADLLLGLGRPVLFDLAGERVVLLPRPRGPGF